MLKDIPNVDLFFKPTADGLPKRFLDIPANHKNYFAKSGAPRVENRIIQNRFPRWTDGINLFETAISAAHAGRQYHKGRVVVRFFLNQILKVSHAYTLSLRVPALEKSFWNIKSKRPGYLPQLFVHVLWTMVPHAERTFVLLIMG
jgi:hypothetical protein